MDIAKTDTSTQHLESFGRTGAQTGVMDPVHHFRALLEQFDGTGETRIIAHQRNGIAELGVMGWAMRALELDSYMTAKKALMDEEGLTVLDLRDMKASERAVFEARVFNSMHQKDDMAQAVKAYEQQELERKRQNLYRVVTIPDPE